VNGSPLRICTIAPTCHPPRTRLAAPVESHGFDSPNGSS
jgi:hypothetical protein